MGLVLRYVPAWLLIGTSTWCVARAFDPNVGWMTSDEIDVSGKVAGVMDRHERIPVGKDLDLALEHDHERTVGTARFK